MMYNLLRIEYTKVANYNAFKILLGGYLIAIFGLFLSIQNFTFGPFQIFSQETLKFPFVWQNVAFVAKYFNLGLGILVILLIGNEYSFDTAKQNVIDGFRRKDLVISKYLIVAFLVLLAMVVITIIGLVLGFLNSTTISSDVIFKDVGYILGFGVHAFAMLSLAALIAYLFRKTAIAILFFLSYAVFVEAIFRNIIDAPFTRYFPSKAMNKIVNTPYSDLVSQIEEFSLQTSPWNEYMLISLGYGFLFLILSVLLVKKRNL